MDENLLNLPRPDAIDNIEIYLNVWKDIRRALESSIAGISDELFVKPMSDGTWCAAEIAEHMARTQCRFARAIPLILEGRIGMDAFSEKTADYESIENYFWEHRKVKNPNAVTPVQIQNKEDSIRALHEAMASFEKNITGAPFLFLQKRAFEHFLFGPMNLVEYTWVLLMHENHHTYVLRKKYF